MQTVRIFISAPRDVGSERALASRVIKRLRFEFRGIVDVEPVFWEQMPAPSAGSRQRNRQVGDAARPPRVYRLMCSGAAT